MVELRVELKILLMGWMFLTVVDDADAGSNDRKRKYYMCLYKLLRLRS